MLPVANHAGRAIAMVDGYGPDAAFASFVSREDAERMRSQQHDFAAPVTVGIHEYPSYSSPCDCGYFAIWRNFGPTHAEPIWHDGVKGIPEIGQLC